MKIKKILLLETLVFICTFFLTQNIWAQIKEFYIEEFYINPDYDSITIPLEVDFSTYSYKWEVIHIVSGSINYESKALGSPSIIVKEWFITSESDFDENEVKKEILPITWSGKRPEGSNFDDGEYRLTVYETNLSNPSIETKRRYKITIDTKPPGFGIKLYRDIINRDRGEYLICNSEHGSEKALTWKIEIKSGDGRDIPGETIAPGVEVPFPRFTWNEYEDLKDGTYYIFVEAADRAGNKFKPDGIPFTITKSNELANIPQNKEENDTDGGDKKFGSITRLLPEEYIIYPVEHGDYLVKIAQKHYGTAHLWGLIYELNKSEFPYPNRPNYIVPGMELKLPPIEFIRDLKETAQQ